MNIGADNSDISNSMEYIWEYLHSDISNSEPVTRIHTENLLAEFIHYGWEPEYINTTFQRLHDNLITGYSFNVFIEQYAKTAAMKLNLESYEAVAEVCTQIGIKPDVALHLEYIVEPLHGSSYCDLQIIDVAIEYQLGRYAPIAPPDATHLIRPDIVDSWVNYTQ